MWSNDLTVSMRVLTRNRTYAAINIAGHAIRAARLNPIHALRYA